MVADPAADDGERIVLFDEFQGFLVFAGSNQGHISLDADMSRTICLAGRGPDLVDGKTAGNSLGELTIDGLPLGEAFIEFGGDVDGADLGAVAATRTLIDVDEPRGLGHSDLEFSRFTLDGFNRAPGQDLHIRMTADLDQFGGKDAG